jgi:hypothetical protein
MAVDTLRSAARAHGINLYGIGDETLARAVAWVGDCDLLVDALQMDPLPKWLADLLVVPRSGSVLRFGGHLHAD